MGFEREEETGEKLVAAMAVSTELEEGEERERERFQTSERF